MNLFSGLASEWCNLTHGGGHIERDATGRVNWQCNKCGRWAQAVPENVERASTDAAIREHQQ